MNIKNMSTNFWDHIELYVYEYAIRFESTNGKCNIGTMYRDLTSFSGLKEPSISLDSCDLIMSV